MVTRPRHAHSINTKTKSPIRRHITRSPSPKTSNSSLRVTAAQALVVSAAKDLDITKLKIRVKKLERANKENNLKLRRLRKVGTSQRFESSDDIDMEDASNQERMIAELDRDEGIALMDDEGAEKKAKDAQVAGDEQVKGKQAEIYQIDMDHAAKVLKQSEMFLELLRFTRQQLQEGQHD
nr:hypothetical protein [Tanacetum cinerariifolium]